MCIGYDHSDDEFRNYVKLSCTLGELCTNFNQKAMSAQLASHELKPIDKSTTYFGLHIVTKISLMENFARKYYHGYQPTEGFGYYELSTMEYELDPSWNVILMDEVPWSYHRHQLFFLWNSRNIDHTHSLLPKLPLPHHILNRLN